MTDETTQLSVTDPHRLQPVFINRVVGQGILNGVVNVTLATFAFTPTAEGNIDPDLVISGRLRMDIACAKQLHDALGGILEQALKPINATTH